MFLYGGLYVCFSFYFCGFLQVYGLLEAGEQLQATLSNLDFTPHSGAENSVLQTQFSASSGNEIYSKKGQFSYRLAEEARLTYNQFCNNLKQESLRQSGQLYTPLDRPTNQSAA